MNQITGGTNYICHIDGEFVGFYNHSGSASEVEAYLEGIYYEEASCSVYSDDETSFIV